MEYRDFVDRRKPRPVGAVAIAGQKAFDLTAGGGMIAGAKTLAGG